MKILDRYLIRSFLYAVLVWFAVLMSLRVVADLFINMDEFAKLGMPFNQLALYIVTYYGYQSIVYAMELGGLILVVAAAFTLARMNQTNELTAILASGVSLYRVITPILISAVLMGGLIVLDQEFLVPQVADRLCRSRDDVPGTKQFPVLLVGDSQGAVFWSPKFHPDQQVMDAPTVHIRDIREAPDETASAPASQPQPRVKFQALAAISAHSARPGQLDGHEGWIFDDAVLLRTLTADKAWENMPDTQRVCTYMGPDQILQAAKDENRQRGTTVPDGASIRWAQATTRDPQYDLTIKADFFQPAQIDPKTNQPIQQAKLERPRFTFTSPDGILLGTFFAESAVWSPQAPCGWALDKGEFFRLSDLDTKYLVLRRSERWLSLMSTPQILELIKLKRLPDPRPAVLTLHTRFTDPIDNVIMLLLALPFILSRERGIKASAGRCLLVVGLFYASIYVCRYAGLAPEWSAWLPILIFGPVAMVLMDAVKT